MTRFEYVQVAPLALTLRFDDDLLSSIGLDWLPDDQPVRPEDREPLSPAAESLRQALIRYLGGREPDWPDLDLNLDALTPFRKAVLETLRREAPFGRFLTYGELAERAGRPGAARAAGRVMATNPWPLLYPCHRVVGGRAGRDAIDPRRLTGFGPGLPMKEFLLKLEGLL